MYFWHPAYDDFPVYGVSQIQVKAYCHWKTRQLRHELKNESIKVELPLSYQYNLVQNYNAYSNRKQKGVLYYSAPMLYYDMSNDFSLKLNNDTTEHLGRFDKGLCPEKTRSGEFITGLHYNLSEWMGDDLNTAYLPYLNYMGIPHNYKEGDVLIQGSNYIDGRYDRDSQTSQGANLRTFAPKNESYPCVGFRYVV